jgi:hypothetical protein
MNSTLQFTGSTYCTPYFTIRVLKFIAELECNDCLCAIKAFLYQTYVDDVCIGGDTLDEAISLQVGLIQVLHSEGMILKKWANNVPTIFDKDSP